ncbi:SDR family oxidoreductase [Alkalihalophilus sp. As8PL]|uniref:SDR family oxidoreductase n=1 Tax=Alkalihalophilus sp. As8PL TaxID=3237103 RepID=A0AB39BVH1_9BACI
MNIFLTGSTGFLGGKLIKNLVSNSSHSVYVLVRNVEKGERIKSTFTPEEQARIHLIKGDITLPSCGLSSKDLLTVMNKVDTFYHLAALVKFDLDLREELFAVNYEGTKHALELATEIGAKAFHYVSTAYTVGKRTRGVEELYDPDVSYNNPYEESKVKSEHLVFSYADKMDVSIFRPSIIVGDSKTGEADSEFTLYGFMRALDLFKRKVNRRQAGQEMTYRLVANKEGTSNLVPVDYVADILALAATEAERNHIYNITNPYPPKNIDLLNMLKQALQFDNLSVVEDASNYELNPAEERLNSMVDVFNDYLAGAIQFEDTNTQNLIKSSPLEHLNMSEATVKMIMNAYFETQLVKG